MCVVMAPDDKPFSDSSDPLSVLFSTNSLWTATPGSPLTVQSGKYALCRAKVDGQWYTGWQLVGAAVKECHVYRPDVYVGAVATDSFQLLDCTYT